MNYKKILAISLILIALSVSLNAVCADSNTIDLGKITSSSMEVNNINEVPDPTGDPLSPSTSSSSTTFDVDFTASIQVDISKMSDNDKELLKKAIDEGNNTLILNITDGHSMSIEMHQGMDMSIDGDTLNIGTSNSYPSNSNSADPKLSSVGIKTSDNHLFVAKN